MWCQSQEVHWHEEAAAAGFLLGVGTGLFVSRLFASPQAPKAKNKPPYRAIKMPRSRRASRLRHDSRRDGVRLHHPRFLQTQNWLKESRSPASSATDYVPEENFHLLQDSLHGPTQDGLPRPPGRLSFDSDDESISSGDVLNDSLPEREIQNANPAATNNYRPFFTFN